MRYPVSSVLLAALLALVVVAGSGGVGALAGTGGAVDGAAVDGMTVDGVAVDDASVEPTGVEPTATTEMRPTLVGQFDPDPRTEITVHPDPDGDADWVVSVQYRFTDANETAVFEEVGDRFRAGEIGPSATLFENFAASASRNIDREMTVEDPDREVFVHDDPGAVGVEDDDVVAVGELRLTFTWTAFLEADGENLVLGDALTTANNGTWVRTLEDGQSIEVQTPEGYSIDGTPGASFDDVSDNSVIIEGPRMFEDDDRVIAIYSPSPGPPWTLLAGAIVVAALLIAAGLLGYRRFGEGGGADGDDAAVGAASESESAEVAGAGATAGGPADGPGAAAADDAGEPEEDLSLLSDEERVERLLENEGGRMRQADVVTETGWSDAKVSQLLSAMADEGRIEKLRLGRENLISLPDDGTGDDAGDSDDAENGGETFGAE
ncbi:helix-turn-helix transcriptional regulator [Halorubrum gandharaense]